MYSHTLKLNLLCLIATTHHAHLSHSWRVSIFSTNFLTGRCSVWSWLLEPLNLFFCLAEFLLDGCIALIRVNPLTQLTREATLLLPQLDSVKVVTPEFWFTDFIWYESKSSLGKAGEKFGQHNRQERILIQIKFEAVFKLWLKLNEEVFFVREGSAVLPETVLVLLPHVKPGHLCKDDILVRDTILIVAVPRESLLKLIG